MKMNSRLNSQMYSTRKDNDAVIKFILSVLRERVEYKRERIKKPFIII